MAPLYGYCLVPADLAVPSEEKEFGRPKMPWENKELVQPFQTFGE